MPSPNSPPDGYTLLMSSGRHGSVNPHIYARMPSTRPGPGAGGRVPARVLCLPGGAHGQPVEDFQAFLADLKANPATQLRLARQRQLAALATEMMKAQTAPFRARALPRCRPSLTDLLGGQLDFLFDPGIGIRHVRSGKLRMIAVGSPQRSPLFPGRAPRSTNSG